MLQQCRQRRLDREVHPVEHHINRVAIRGNVVGWLANDRPNPGVGEHEVEASQFGHAVVHHGLESLEVADVGLFGDDAPTGLLDQVDGFVEVLGRGHRVGNAVDL